MKSRCETCGVDLPHKESTHCSNRCLFSSLWNSKSIEGDPIEKWIDSDPWV